MNHDPHPPAPGNPYSALGQAHHTTPAPGAVPSSPPVRLREWSANATPEPAEVPACVDGLAACYARGARP